GDESDLSGDELWVGHGVAVVRDKKNPVIEKPAGSEQPVTFTRGGFLRRRWGLKQIARNRAGAAKSNCYVHGGAVHASSRNRRAPRSTCEVPAKSAPAPREALPVPQRIAVLFQL